MRVISYLGTLDQVFGAPATTRSWNTVGCNVILSDLT